MVSSALPAREVMLIPTRKKNIQHDYKIFEMGDATHVDQYMEGTGKETRPLTRFTVGSVLVGWLEAPTKYTKWHADHEISIFALVKTILRPDIESLMGINALIGRLKSFSRPQERLQKMLTTCSLSVKTQKQEFMSS
jgi:hypothetical protein